MLIRYSGNKSVEAGQFLLSSFKYSPIYQQILANLLPPHLQLGTRPSTDHG